MLSTSQTYKDLFAQGAIEEYKIVVDGIEYLDDAIYDNVILKQQLFSTDTFSVGGFALSSLDVKLKIPTTAIPRNAFIKFYYRLTNGEEHSEWIPKFNGRVVKRRRTSEDVTTIEALSKGANYDVFLDVFPNATDIYPANNRQVSNLCATHLGLEIDNINDVYDGNNVEYPNELTIIEVLQNIAALSGGNWIITPDDKLRLVVLNKTNNLYQGEITKPLGVGQMELARNLILKKGQSLTFSYQEYESTTGETPEQLLLYFTDVRAKPNQSVLIDTSEKEASFILEEDFSRVFIYGDFNYATSIERECTISDMLLIENDVLHTYSAFNIVSEESISPISRITMYYQDDKAFTAGDDTGAELIIDCPWATQETTDYVKDIYYNYVYKPIQGLGVAVDASVQLGDHFKYSSGEVQLVSKVEYTFAGSAVATISTPSNNEVAYDDPFKQLTQAPLKRKVTLGDSYQGVTISRQNGIMMLMSPDGTEENALAKYYSDLNKGMAFQYRKSVDDPWEDWLYYDINEGRFKMMLKGGEDLEGKLVIIEADLDTIKQEIKNITNGNLIPNLNGQDGYFGWSGNSDLVVSDELEAQDFMTAGLPAVIKDIEGSEVPSGWQFRNSGELLSPFGYVIPNEFEYSFRGKVGNFKPFTINLYEYKGMSDNKELINTQTFDMVGNVQYQQFTTTLQEETRHVQLGFNVPTATLNDPMTLTEMMFNRGQPKPYYQSVQDAIMYGQSILAITSEQISLSNEKIDKVSGDIHNTVVNIDGFDGVVIKNSNGKGLTVLNDQGDKVIELNANGDVISRNMIAENITATGVINAIRGEIGNFEIEDGVLSYTSPLYNKVYDYSDMAILHGLVRKEITPTQFMYNIYDLNNDGKFDAVDTAMMTANIRGEYPLDRKIKSLIRMGTQTGEIQTTVLSAESNQGPTSIMRADKIESELLNATGIGTEEINFKQREVYIDSNGFLKAR